MAGDNKPRTSWFWIRNTDGEKDATLTFALWAVLCVMFKFVAAGATLTIGAKTFAAGAAPDGGVIAALLMPTLGAYVARRHTEANAPKGEEGPK